MSLHKEKRETDKQESFDTTSGNRHRNRKADYEKGKSNFGEDFTDENSSKKKKKSKSEGSKLKSVDNECEKMTEKLLMRHYASLNQFLKERQDSSIQSKDDCHCHKHHRHSKSRTNHRHKSRTSSQLSLITQCSIGSEYSRRCNQLRRSYNVARHCCKSRSHRRHDSYFDFREHSRRGKSHFPIIKNMSDSSLDYSIHAKNKGFMHAVKQASYLRRQSTSSGDHDKTDLNILYCSAGELRGVLQRVARRMAQDGWKPPNKKQSQASKNRPTEKTQVSTPPVTTTESPQPIIDKLSLKESKTRLPQTVPAPIPTVPPQIQNTTASSERKLESGTNVKAPEQVQPVFGVPSFYPNFPSFFQYPNPQFPQRTYDYYGGAGNQYPTTGFQTRPGYFWNQYQCPPTSNGDWNKQNPSVYTNDHDNDFFKSMQNEWNNNTATTPYF